MKIITQKTREKLLIGLCSFIIAIVGFRHINLLDGVRIMGDEYAYWGIGAYFAGFEWQSMQHTAYYSYGYSLLLMPLLLLLHLGIKVTVIYKLAIGLNVFFMIAGFWISIRVSKFFFEHIPAGCRIICCLITALYINNIVQAGYAWDETCLYFLFWCTVLAFIRMMEKPTLSRLFLLIAVSVYIMMVHMRAAGVLISVALVLLLYLFMNQKKLGYKPIIVAVIMLTAGIFLFAFGKSYVSTHVYGNNASLAHNTMEGQAGKITLLFSMTGIADLCNSLAGKLFYQGIASFFLVPAAMCAVMWELAGKTCTSLKKRRILFDGKTWTALMIILAVLGEFIISSVFKVITYYSAGMITDRIDNIFYGRYAEFAMGPLILTGLLLLYRAGEHLIIFLISVAGIGITAVVVQKQFDILINYPATTERDLNESSFSGIYYLMNGTYENLAYRLLGAALLIFLSCMLIGWVFEKFKYRKYCCLAYAFLLAGIWVYFGTARVEEAATEKNWRDKSYRSIAVLTEKADYSGKSYFVTDGSKGAASWLQWWIPQIDLEEITSAEFLDRRETEGFEGHLVFTNPGEIKTAGLLSDTMNYVYNSGEIAVFVQRGTALEAEIQEHVEESYEYNNPHWYEVDLENVKTVLSDQKPDGSLRFNWSQSEGYMTWQTGEVLADGLYEFVIDMKISDISQDAGYITVTNEENTWLDTRVLSAEDFPGGGRNEITVQIPVKNYEHPVIGIYCDGEHSVSVYGMKYRQLNSRAVLEDDEAFKEFGNTLEGLASQITPEVCYIDTDGSGSRGFMDLDVLNTYFPGGIVEYITGDLLPCKESHKDKALIVENRNKTEIFYRLLSDFIMIEYRSDYSLWLPRTEETVTALKNAEMSALTPEKDAIDLVYLGEAFQNEGSSYRLTLQTGHYSVRTDITSRKEVAGWLTVGEEKWRVCQAEETVEFYVDETAELEIALLPESIGQWEKADCLLTWVDNNSRKEIPFDPFQSSGTMRTENAYLVKGEAILSTETFTLGARDYGMRISFTGESRGGYVEYYRNGELRETLQLLDAQREGNGTYVLEYRTQEHDLADWQIKVYAKADENAVMEVLDAVTLMEYGK